MSCRAIFSAPSIRSPPSLGRILHRRRASFARSASAGYPSLPSLSTLGCERPWRDSTTNQIPGGFGRKEASWGYGFSVICKERWPYFGGGLVPEGTATHAGAGGMDHWIDFENQIVGVYYEIVTEMSDMLEPISSAGHRFQDVITAAVVD